MPTHERILVIEDDADIQGNLRELLESEGYDVNAAFNGAEALTLLRAGRRPSAILLDLMMPVMNGYQFLDALRREPEEARVAIPTILVSAASDAASASTRHDLPVVRKPFDIELLLETLRNAIGVRVTI